MQTGQFFYIPKGRTFRIYQCDYLDDDYHSAKAVPDEPLYNDRETARRRVYELNGWTFPPKPKRHDRTQTSPPR